METKKVLILDNDIPSALGLEGALPRHFDPRVLIGLTELEPILKGTNRDVEPTELSPNDFPPVAFVSDTMNSILCPVAELTRVLRARNVCCIATSITRRSSLANADFGVNRMRIASWIHNWLSPIYAVAANHKPGPIGNTGKQNVLVINKNMEFCLSMTQLLHKNRYPCLEPLIGEIRIEGGKIVGKNTGFCEVEISLDQLALVFVPASSNEPFEQALAMQITQLAKATGVCCVGTSLNQMQMLQEVDFMLDEDRRRKFVELWMQAIYPTACRMVRKG